MKLPSEHFYISMSALPLFAQGLDKLINRFAAVNLSSFPNSHPMARGDCAPVYKKNRYDQHLHQEFLTLRVRVRHLLAKKHGKLRLNLLNVTMLAFALRRVRAVIPAAGFNLKQFEITLENMRRRLLRSTNRKFGKTFYAQFRARWILFMNWIHLNLFYDRPPKASHGVTPLRGHRRPGHGRRKFIADVDPVKIEEWRALAERTSADYVAGNYEPDILKSLEKMSGQRIEVATSLGDVRGRDGTVLPIAEHQTRPAPSRPDVITATSPSGEGFPRNFSSEVGSSAPRSVPIPEDPPLTSRTKDVDSKSPGYTQSVRRQPERLPGSPVPMAVAQSPNVSCAHSATTQILDSPPQSPIAGPAPVLPRTLDDFAKLVSDFLHDQVGDTNFWYDAAFGAARLARRTRSDPGFKKSDRSPQEFVESTRPQLIPGERSEKAQCYAQWLFAWLRQLTILENIPAVTQAGLRLAISLSKKQVFDMRPFASRFG